MYQLNGKKISLDRDLTIGEGDAAITYPAGSLKNAELRTELGIVDVPDLVRPDDRLYFVTENEDGSFSTEPRPVDQVMAPVWDSIKARRDQAKAGGVKVGTKWYHTDTESRIQHLGLLKKAEAARAAGGGDTTRLQALGQDIRWKTMDGSFIYLTVKHAEDVFAAVTDLDAASFAVAEGHRAAAAAAENPFEYDFWTGWTASYTPEV